MKASPYTYLIGWSQHDKWYYGVRYAKNAHPDDLWNPYKTSSKHVKSFIEAFGEPDVIQVRKTFRTALQAREWEHKVLRRMRAIHRSDFLNKTDNKSISPDACVLGAITNGSFRDTEFQKEMNRRSQERIRDLLEDPEWLDNRNAAISKAKKGKPNTAAQTTSYCVGCRELVQPSRLLRSHRSCFNKFTAEAVI